MPTKAQKQYKAKRAARIAAGLCTTCGKKPAGTTRLCEGCQQKQNARNRKYYAAHTTTWRAAGLCPGCGKQPPKGLDWCLSCRRDPADARAWHVRVRLDVIQHYGGSCTCCGDTREFFLTIDHVDNDGKAHRKEVGSNIYAWLRRNNYPDDKRFQLLCGSCHLAKSRLGHCPCQQPHDYAH